MSWENTRGHDRLVEHFRQIVANNRLSHSYLFIGPEGVGKKLFAHTLAQCLFCERHADARLLACGECQQCRQMLAGTHPDLLSAGCPEGKNELPIEVLVGAGENRGREGLCYELSLRPMEGERRFAIVDDADKMNDSSANAILKTLEEPPDFSTLILIATNVDRILPTIRSRCQQVRFDPLSDEDLTALIVELDYVPDAERAQAIVGLSQGSPAVAAQLASPELESIRGMLYKQLATGSLDPIRLTRQVLEKIDEESNTQLKRRNAVWLVRFLLEFFRQTLRTLAGATGPFSLPEAEAFVRQARLIDPEGSELVGRMFERTALAESQIDQHVGLPLCFEALFNDLAKLMRAYGQMQRV